MSYFISDLISKSNFFYQQHSYYQQSFVNMQSNQFFYCFIFQFFNFFIFQFFYFFTFQFVYFSVSPFQQQFHFFFVFWYIQMDYQWSFLFNQQSAVMSTIINNIFLFKAKNIEFFDFNSNVTQMIEIKNNYNIYHNVFSFTQWF